MANIGEPVREIEVEPLVEPVPSPIELPEEPLTPTPERQPEPDKVPA